MGTSVRPLLGAFRIGKSLRVVFDISGSGEILTIKSSSGIGYVKTGSVYRYCSTSGGMNDNNKHKGKPLNIEDLRKLAKKGKDITLADFAPYAHWEIDPDRRLLDMEGLYTVNVWVSADGDTACIVTEKTVG